MTHAEDHILRFYGRRKGKKLRDRRLDAYEKVLPDILIDLDSEAALTPQESALRPTALDGNWIKTQAQITKSRNLRKTPTAAENLFWQKVRNRLLDGHKFKRQFPLDKFYVDFVCHEKMLVVEIDSDDKDSERTKILNDLGYDVLRLSSAEVLGNIDAALATLTKTLDAKETKAHPRSLPIPPPPLSEERAAALLDLEKLFPQTKKIALEIGFGDGKHLLHQAMQNPDIGYIGCEPFINGVALLCADIKDHNIKNIRIWPDDARLLMAMLPDQCLDTCYLLNSDPWPKNRHSKRRFVQTETLDDIRRLLKPGALFRMSSDHPVLAAWQLEKTYLHGGFTWNATSAADWRNRPADFPETRYQQKGVVEGRDTVFLNFTRV